MSDDAAAPRARRVEWRPVLALAGYLLVAPPAFVLGPLAGLLLLSRPRTWREWAWIAVAAGTSVIWLARPGNAAGQVIRATVVLVTGAYLALWLWRPAAGWARACFAVALGGGGLALLMAGSGVDWRQWYQTVAYAFRVAGREWPADLHRYLPALGSVMVVVFPVLLALIALVGVQLAWTWHCLLAERPAGGRLCTGDNNP